MRINIIRYFLSYIGLIPHCRVHRAVEIPAAGAAIGTNDHQMIFICKYFQLWHPDQPVAVPAPVTMEEINNGESTFLLFIRGRIDHHTFECFLHGVAVDADGVDSGSL